jgi:hypothetical protein
MKYLKSFENKTLDEILDKISTYGMKSLTPLELTFLKDYDNVDLKNKINQSKNFIKSRIDYDPRKDDTDFYKKNNISFDDWSDEEIENSRYDILWNSLEEDDIEDFITKYKIAIGNTESWDNLTDDIKNKFKKYIKTRY